MLSLPVQITLLYASGIIAGKFIFIPIEMLIFSLLTVFAGMIFLVFRRQKALYIILVMAFLFGMTAYGLADKTVQTYQKPDPTSLFARISDPMRTRLMSVIHDTMDEPYATLMGSVVFGTQASPISDDLQEKYRVAGVIHVLVASGTQVSIVLSIILYVCSALRVPKTFEFIFASAFNLLFIFVAGTGASIIRAAIMGEMMMSAKLLGRDSDVYNALSMSALLILIFVPLDIFDLGFQLSFLATWSLFYLAPALSEKLHERMPSLASDILGASLGPMLATSPVILFNFGQFSFVSLFANMAIVPWVESTVILGFISTFIGLLFLPVAYAINNILTIILFLLNTAVSFFSSLPFAARNIALPPWPVFVMYYVILIGGIEVMKNNIKVNIRLTSAILCVLFLASFTFSTFASSPELAVTYIDVGQGDSILIESPSGMKALIDGGGRQESRNPRFDHSDKEDPVSKYTLVPFLAKKGINKIDYVFLTHPHDDHVAGLPYVLKRMQVGCVYDPGASCTSRAYKRFLDMIDEKHIPYKLARAGMKFDLGGGVKGEILYPTEDIIRDAKYDLNNDSTVIRLVYGRTSFLFTGDMGFPGEKVLLSEGADLGSNVLKVGHHGSRYATSPEFLDAVAPGAAVISVGAKNKFGHPNSGVIARLEDRNIRVFRTDQNGNVLIKSDGEKLVFYPDKASY